MILCTRKVDDYEMILPTGTGYEEHVFHLVLDWSDKKIDVYMCRWCGAMFGRRRDKPIIQEIAYLTKQCRY